MRTRFAVTAALACGLLVGTATAGQASPDTQVLDLRCSNGQQYSITVLTTTAEQAAVRVVAGTSVIVPTSFQWHVVVTDAEGTVLDESTTGPYSVHGRSVERLSTVTCT